MYLLLLSSYLLLFSFHHSCLSLFIALLHQSSLSLLWSLLPYSQFSPLTHFPFWLCDKREEGNPSTKARRRKGEKNHVDTHNHSFTPLFLPLLISHVSLCITKNLYTMSWLLLIVVIPLRPNGRYGDEEEEEVIQRTWLRRISS